VIPQPTIVPPAPRVAPAPPSFRVAGPPSRWRSIDGRLRGVYRVAEDDLERYELFVGQDGEPDPTGTPDATSATLPFAHALAAGHVYRLLVRKRNAYDLTSENISATTIRLAGDGTEDPTPPSGPEDVLVEAAAGGAVRIRAWYQPGPDAANAADTFAVWIETGGGAPDPDVDPATTTASMVDTDGTARLDYTTGAYADGTTVKVVVRTRRSGPPDVDSENTDVHTVEAETDGPATPASAGAHLGTSAEVAS